MAVTPRVLNVKNNSDARIAELEVTGISTPTGAVTAPAGITGNITGNLTGNVTGTVAGVPLQPQTLTASGAITVGSNGVVQLNHATVVIAATLAAPTAGAVLLIVDNSASGTAAHTVTCAAGVTFDGTNNTATLNAPGEALILVALSATRWFIVLNIGAVALSSV